jgi:hypothetical protein
MDYSFCPEILCSNSSCFTLSELGVLSTYRYFRLINVASLIVPFHWGPYAAPSFLLFSMSLIAAEASSSSLIYEKVEYPLMSRLPLSKSRYQLFKSKMRMFSDKNYVLQTYEV